MGKSVQDLIDEKSLKLINHDELLLSDLSSLKGLENFNAEEAKKVYMCIITDSSLNSSLKYLKYLPNITVLSINDNDLTSIKGVECLKKLKHLYIDDNPIKSIEEILELPDLEWISLKGCGALEKYRGLHPKSIKEKILVEKHLKPDDELRGTVSIMDTGLFDFKIK